MTSKNKERSHHFMGSKVVWVQKAGCFYYRTINSLELKKGNFSLFFTVFPCLFFFKDCSETGAVQFVPYFWFLFFSAKGGMPEINL